MIKKQSSYLKFSDWKLVNAHKDQEIKSNVLVLLKTLNIA